MNTKTFIPIVVFIHLTIALIGQKDSLSTDYDFVNKPVMAELESFVFNAAINRFDAYLFRGGQDWAKVSPSSWSLNIRRGLEWDWDSFGTNFFGHPFQGSVYYNSARSLGMSYWESAPYTFVNSMMWEYLGETLKASGNDLITTTFGGIQLGEITHRISDKLYEYPSRGVGRVWRVGLSTIINPMRTFNRWAFGKPKNGNELKGSDKPWYDLKGYFSLGSNIQLRNSTIETKGLGAFVEFEMTYGNPYQSKDFYEPFEFFEFTGWLRFIDVPDRQYPFLNISTEGILWGKNISYGDDYSILIGTFQHFDYFHDEVIELGSIGFSGGIHYKSELTTKSTLEFQLHTGPTILGGSNNEIVEDFADIPEAVRDYIFGIGYLAKSELSIDHDIGGRLSTSYRHYTFYITSGPEGVEHLNLLSFRYTLPLWKSHRIGVDYSRYFRRVKYYNYNDYQDIRKDLYELRAFLSYQF